MIPKTLSASSCSNFEDCEAMFKAENIDKVPDVSTYYADLGTACHAALETFVATGAHLTGTLTDLLNMFEAAYRELFTDDEHFKDGADMLKAWHARMDWTGRTVLSTESKEHFSLKVPGYGEIPFTYIFDRMDQLEDGSIEVVDYKTIRLPVQPAEMMLRIQPRVYALAAKILYPDAPAIWVTYDMLRYDTVGAKFTRDDCAATWRYLQDLAARVIASDGSQERLNPGCRWCVRRATCNTLNANVDGGGIMAIGSLNEAIDRRAQLNYAKRAMDSMLTELDDYIMEALKNDPSEPMSVETDDTILTIKSKGRRQLDSERASAVLGEEIMSRYGSITLTEVERLYKAGIIDGATHAKLKPFIRKIPGKAYLETKPKNDVSGGLI